ncbi:Transcription elongation factor B polypeptide 3 [Eumeta japonica]|uniref:Transcription elongation factor B polypeptide 3 n=1 Tax=Eumeta variegata TaxID=151549 RepID=A0A4C1T0V5_EUMVA|nr:Transcription elongation factor B polypeptide 3 [Eumeta japonica]
MAPIVEVLQHYQRSIDETQARLFHCINKIKELPVRAEHLEETGAAVTINSLRNSCKEIDMAAETLAAKWKTMIEEKPIPTKCPAISECKDNIRTEQKLSPTSPSKFSINLSADAILGCAILDTIADKRRHNCDDDYTDSPQAKIAKLSNSMNCTTVSQIKMKADDSSVPIVRTGPVFQVPSLVQMCTKAVQENINDVLSGSSKSSEITAAMPKEITTSATSKNYTNHATDQERKISLPGLTEIAAVPSIIKPHETVTTAASKSVTTFDMFEKLDKTGTQEKRKISMPGVKVTTTNSKEVTSLDVMTKVEKTEAKEKHKESMPSVTVTTSASRKLTTFDILRSLTNRNRRKTKRVSIQCYSNSNGLKKSNNV